MLKTYYQFLIGLVVLFYANRAIAQSDSASLNKSSEKVYSAAAHWAAMFVHTEHVRNVGGAHPRGFDVQFSKLHLDKNIRDNWGFFPMTGWSFTYFDLNTPILGKSYSFAYFLQPEFRMSSRMFLQVRASAGISILSNPYDSIKNPSNQSYSLPVNAFFQLQAGINYGLSKHITLFGTAVYNHNSNGGFAQPNRGINFPGFSVGLSYYTQNSSLPKYKVVKDYSWKNEKRQWMDAGLFFSPKEGYKGDFVSTRKIVLGGMAQMSRRVSRVSAISGSAEIYYDDAIKSIKKIIHDSSSNILAGIMIGHELLINRFIFSQQIGVYVFKQTKYLADNYLFYPYSTVYERYGLRYRFSKHYFGGLSLLSRGDVADFVDFRILYRF